MKTEIICGKLVGKIESMDDAFNFDSLGCELVDYSLDPINIEELKEDWYNNWKKCHYAIIKDNVHEDWTVLYSSYKLGQTVYVIKDNKITAGKIKDISLATGCIYCYAVIEIDGDSYTYNMGRFFKTPQDCVTDLLNNFNEKEV